MRDTRKTLSFESVLGLRADCYRQIIDGHSQEAQLFASVPGLSSQLILPCSCSRCWTGTSLQMRLTRGEFSNANDMNLFLMIFPRISFHCKTIFLAENATQYLSRLWRFPINFTDQNIAREITQTRQLVAILVAKQSHLQKSRAQKNRGEALNWIK